MCLVFCRSRPLLLVIYSRVTVKNLLFQMALTTTAILYLSFFIGKFMIPVAYECKELTFNTIAVHCTSQSSFIMLQCSLVFKWHSPHVYLVQKNHIR